MKFINLIKLDKLYHTNKVQGDCYLDNLSNVFTNHVPKLDRNEKKTNPVRVCLFLVHFVQPFRWHVSPYYQHLLLLCRPNLLALLCRKILTLWLFPQIGRASCRERVWISYVGCIL